MYVTMGHESTCAAGRRAAAGWTTEPGGAESDLPDDTLSRAPTGVAARSERASRRRPGMGSAGPVATDDGRAVWVLDVHAGRRRGLEPLLVLHGFPSCSYDWRLVLDALRAPGAGSSPSTSSASASRTNPTCGTACGCRPTWSKASRRDLGLTSVAMLTHDMGDTVGGELLARSLEGTLPFAVTQRVLTNGSIYIDMAHLSNGQQLLLSLDDAATDLVVADGFKGGLAGTFSADSTVDADELDAQWLFAERNGGNRLLPRTIATSKSAAPRNDDSPARSRPTRRRSRSCGAPTTRSRSSR